MKKLWFMLFCLIPALLFGQTNVIKGKVSTAEDGSPVPFANVYNKRTQNGVVSDAEGMFSLEASIGDEIECSYVGLRNFSFTVNSFDFLDIRMEEEGALLDEVVVVGFSTSTKKELTGAVSVVKADQVESLNPTRLEQALQGQTAGLQISSQSGSPGGGFNIRIRGITSNGNNNPLILVDGVRYEDLSSLDPSSIESINVLKDASASIYGVQAANGVILITTKKGREGAKPTVDFHYYYGVQETARKIPVLNAQEYAVLINEAYVNGGNLPPYTNISGLGEGTDWQDEVFQQAPITNATLNIRGGGERSSYAVGAAWFRQEGIVGGDKAFFERYNANLNYETSLSKSLKLQTIIGYSNVLRRGLLENAIGSVLFNALNMSPLMPVTNAQGAFTLADGLGSEVINPLAQIANSFNRTDVDRVNGKTGLIFSPIEGLQFESALAFNYSNVRYVGFGPEIYYGVGKVFNNTESVVNENFQLFSSWAWDNVVNYSRTFADLHKFKATLGTSLYEEKYRGLFGTGFGIPNNSYNFAALSQANEIRDGGTSSGRGIFRLASVFARAEYSYDSKYLVSVILRRDATSRFGPDYRFGYFPSVALGWVVSQEPFLQDAENLDFLKLRFSYGETGNDKIGDFRYLSSLNGEAEYVFDGNRLDRSGQAIGAIPNPEIQWERNTQLNLGVDASFFNEKLSVTADYFIKESNDLLLTVPVSGLTGASAPGASAPVANAGSIRNTGLELQLNYSGNIGSNLTFDLGVNGTKLKNETTGLADGVAFISGGVFGIGQLPPTRWETGMPIGYFFGLQTAGVFQSQDEIETHARQQNATVGDLKYVDLNNDGVIDQNDRTFIGSPIPDYVFGMNFALKYKNFDFSAFAEAQYGRDLIRNYERNLPLTNKTSYYIDRWYGPGTSQDFPKASIGANDNDLFSDFWIEDGSYLRIKNAQLGYTFPKSWLASSGLQQIRLYASVNNLFTFTRYSGYDPNISSGDPLASGIDIGFYPQARTYISGLKVIF